MAKNGTDLNAPKIPTIELPEYYTMEDIRTILRLGRTRAYRLVEKAYKDKDTFTVRMICGMYRIEKKSFDEWLEKQ